MAKYMDTPARKIFLTLWRDTGIALVVLYFGLLILNTLLNDFVQVLIPLTGIGWVAAAMIICWLFFKRSTKG
ncbi:MAG: hypothetical protein ACD_43C00107G0002 [uncultured bacterium]|nr:MAG: hypothetical protein ACD_43C00107G0002 [uncultured bacterium]